MALPQGDWARGTVQVWGGVQGPQEPRPCWCSLSPPRRGTRLGTASYADGGHQQPSLWPLPQGSAASAATGPAPGKGLGNRSGLTPAGTEGTAQRPCPRRGCGAARCPEARGAGQRATVSAGGDPARPPAAALSGTLRGAVPSVGSWHQGGLGEVWTRGSAQGEADAAPSPWAARPLGHRSQAAALSGAAFSPGACEVGSFRSLPSTLAEDVHRPSWSSWPTGHSREEVLDLLWACPASVEWPWSSSALDRWATLTLSSAGPGACCSPLLLWQASLGVAGLGLLVSRPGLRCAREPCGQGCQWPQSPVAPGHGSGKVTEDLEEMRTSVTLAPTP